MRFDEILFFFFMINLKMENANLILIEKWKKQIARVVYSVEGRWLCEE